MSGTDSPRTQADTPARPAGPTALVVPMRRILLAGGIAAAVALPLAALVGYLLAGVPGAWGGLIGMAIPVCFFAITAASALLTARLGPTALGAAVLGSWLVKIVLLLVVLALLRDADFYSRGMLFAALLLGTAGLLTLEAVIVSRTKVPYVEPVGPGTAPNPAADPANSNQ